MVVFKGLLYNLLKELYNLAKLTHPNNQENNKDTVLKVATNKKLFKEIYGIDIDKL